MITVYDGCGGSQTQKTKVELFSLLTSLLQKVALLQKIIKTVQRIANSKKYKKQVHCNDETNPIIQHIVSSFVSK